MSAVIELQPPAPPARPGSPAATVLSHALTVQEVMKSVMKPNVHYGAIPGAGDKPTLLKSGAEVLCMTFRIADDYEVQDLSSSGTVRYRVKCIGRHQGTGMVLGAGLGECSSDEEKYKWRKAVCKEEFDATDPAQRRVKYGRKQGGHYTVQQVRTESADLANTALKMACKRAKIAMVLNVTAASDMFSQDVEDLDAELVRHLAEDERQAQVQVVRDDWINRAETAKDTNELTAVFNAGKAALNKLRDIDGFRAFSSRVGEIGKSMKAEEAANV